MHGSGPLVQMWFICDGLGIALSLLTWTLLGFSDWVVCRHVFVSWFSSPRPRISYLPFTDLGCVLFLVYQAILGLSWFSHFQAATTDPGTIRQRDAPIDLVNPRVCKLCKDRWKPPRAHHCKTCHRCIFRMDHHCPWINNCVGLHNQKLFILFLGYTALSAVVTLLLLVSSGAFWLWSQSSWSDAAAPSSTALICAGIVVVVCLGAVLFVGDFLQEQIESIQMNSTLVETYQHTHGRRTTFDDHFRTIFGSPWWVWPWPFPTAEPPDYVEPAIPDDQGGHMEDDLDTLGIAGGESEAAAGHERTSGDMQGLRQRYGDGALQD